MILIENVEVFNIRGAIRAMRNPLDSWDRSDSIMCEADFFQDCKSTCEVCPRKNESFEDDIFCVGKADLDLMHRLYVAGPPHRKYLRQIFLCMDITAPSYLWSEIDTYKVGVTRNSCSFMHRGLSEPFTVNKFSRHFMDEHTATVWSSVVDELNRLRDIFNETKNPYVFQEIRDLLPSGYNIKSTITCSYENIVNMIEWRSDHRLIEWQEFCETMLHELPYLKEIMGK